MITIVYRLLGPASLVCIHVSMSVCLSLCLSVYPSIHLSITHPGTLSVPGTHIYLTSSTEIKKRYRQRPFWLRQRINLRHFWCVNIAINWYKQQYVQRQMDKSECVLCGYSEDISRHRRRSRGQGIGPPLLGLGVIPPPPLYAVI